MKSLLWRESRLNGSVLIGGAVLLLLPYLFVLALFLWPSEISPKRSAIAEGVAIAAISSNALSQLTVALIGANAFAGERADRSAEFMAYLPVSKTNRLFSKLILIAIVMICIWMINLSVLWALHNLLPFKLEIGNHPFTAGHTLLVGLMMFGMAWFISSLVSSPSLSAIVGVATPLILIGGLSMVYQIGHEVAPDVFVAGRFNRFFQAGFTSIGLTLAVLGFAFGTWYYLKHIEP